MKDKKNLAFLFILGGSGSGKTFLGNNLAEHFPKNFKKVTQCTSREMRSEEIQDKDYHFMTKQELESKFKTEDFIGCVRDQFPNIYGTRLSECDDDKINILILSVEGFLDAILKIRKEEMEEAYVTVLFIDNVKNPDIERKGRNASSEELYTRSILKALCSHEHTFDAITVNYEEFKKYRDNLEDVLNILYDKSTVELMLEANKFTS